VNYKPAHRGRERDAWNLSRSPHRRVQTRLACTIWTHRPPRRNATSAIPHPAFPGLCGGKTDSLKLVTANVPPTVAQMLTISLTMDRYTHLGIVDLVAGLKRLPAMAGMNGAVKAV
jgi:hypothetical protein